MRTLPMAQHLMPSLLLLLALSGWVAPVLGADTVALPADYSDTCLKDKSKPYSTDNYQDCKTTETVAQGNTVCCTVGDSIGCCPPTSAKSGRMVTIAFSIIGVALAIGIVVYICTWCDRDSWPCIGRIEDAWRPHQHKLEESIVCCRDRVERRRLEEEHRKKYAARDAPAGDDDDFDDDQEGGGAAGGGAAGSGGEDVRRANLKLEAPQEFKAKVQDSWF